MSLGLMWSKKTETVNFSFFNNYRTAINNYLQRSITEIDSVDQLSQISNLIIVDEHYEHHNKLIFSPKFIKEINKHNVNVIIFNTEKIFNSHWKHNLETQKKIGTINNYVQILSDVRDIKKLGTPFKNKQYLSKEFKYKKLKNEKINEILFFGQMDGSAYKKRRKTIDKISKSINLPFKIIKSNRSLLYEDYLNLLSQYKFVLNPLGAGEFVNIRYYEALGVGAIPIQQMTKEMKLHYEYEIDRNVSLNFIKSNTLKSFSFENIKFQPFNFYLEDYLYQNELKSLFKY